MKKNNMVTLLIDYYLKHSSEEGILMEEDWKKYLDENNIKFGKHGIIECYGVSCKE